MTSTSLSVAIVGGGIGGLAAAVLLTQDGHRVRVFEQTSRFARVGAGIQMTPNAMKVLRRIGAEPALRKIAFQSPAGISREWDSGNISNELKIGAEIEERLPIDKPTGRALPAAQIVRIQVVGVLGVVEDKCEERRFAGGAKVEAVARTYLRMAEAVGCH